MLVGNVGNTVSKGSKSYSSKSYNGSEKNKHNKLLAVLLPLFLLAGCVAPDMYSWGGYENAIYKYYKKPDSEDQFLNALESALAKGESSSNVAPGLYAEAGYIYLERGDGQKAIEYFSKEKALWPESVELMDRMIASISIIDSQTTTSE